MPVVSPYEILDGFYILGQTIGRGGFAKVKKATHIATGERVAIKILDKASLGEDLPRVTKEIETLQTLKHQHICKLFQVLETDDHIFMVMEYCRGGELFDYIVQRDRLEENEAKRIFRQIASAVAFIHSRGVAHRDLKPENILLDDMNNVKLIDFGLCASPAGGMKVKLETCCGSPAYAAPELVKGERYVGSLADVWSMGVLLYALLNGFLPFDDQNISNLYKKILAGKYEEPKWLSDGSKNILHCMLRLEPHTRLSVDQLLTHTWCHDGGPIIPVHFDYDPLRAILETDVLDLMSKYLFQSIDYLRKKISKWDYRDYDVATYLILVERKNRCGVFQFRSIPLRIDAIQYQPQHHYLKVQKSLQEEFSECDSVDNFSTPLSPPRTTHASMEGGLDDCNLLQFGSPKAVEENGNGDFIRPRIPTPKKSRNAENLAFPVCNLSPARSAESVFTDSPKTPAREKWANLDQRTPARPCPSPSPSRRKMLGSLERGLDKVRNMLTPKSSKKKLKILNYYGHKETYNITATASYDPDCVMSELKLSLEKLGATYEQKGYRLVGKWSERQGEDNILTGRQVKFELEALRLAENEPLAGVGIKRKRVHGDAWLYKSVVEQILNLTGVCKVPEKKKIPMQTMV